jgi:DDE superfamily endonuclease
MSPLLRTTLGLKGHRPVVGHLDRQALGYLFGALNLVTGQLTTRLIEKPGTPATPKKNPSGQRRWQEGCARHVRDIARAYAAAPHPRVGLVIDHAPWHRGALITETLKECPHLELSRLPSYSPQLQVIERFWRVLRRRATHNRLFVTLAQLKQALRNTLCYDQTLKHRVLSAIRSPKKRTQLSAA